MVSFPLAFGVHLRSFELLSETTEEDELIAWCQMRLERAPGNGVTECAVAKYLWDPPEDVIFRVKRWNQGDEEWLEVRFHPVPVVSDSRCSSS